MTSPGRLVPLALVAVLALSACGGAGGAPGSGPGGSEQAPGGTDADGGSWLEDELEMNTYRLEGTIDGEDWSTLICALNYEPTWEADRAGATNPTDALVFESWDGTIASGRVSGGWDYDGSHGVQVIGSSSTFTRSGAGTATEPGTLTLDLDVIESWTTDGGGRIDRTVTGTLDLVPLVTPDENGQPCGFPMSVDDLKSWNETYEGPSGGGL